MLDILQDYLGYRGKICTRSNMNTCVSKCIYYILYSVCMWLIYIWESCVICSISLFLLLSYSFILSPSSSGYSYERLDGSVRGEERFLAVQNFSKDEDTFIFLLSTRAGHQ